MPSYFNIETRPNHSGAYVGYARGAWRIVKCFGQWRATKRDTLEGFGGMTLRAISRGLAHYERTGELPPVTPSTYMVRSRAVMACGE